MSPAEKLKAEGYTLEARLHHQELVTFILPWLSLKHRVIRIFFAVNLVFILSFLSATVYYWLNSEITAGTIFIYFSYGCALTFALIPLHEFIHGLAYRYCGAEKVSYKANWKKMYFMAMADGFITSGKQFLLIGLAPFVLISLLLLLLSWYTGPLTGIMLLTTLVIHGGMCAGDFALISFFDASRDREMVTYDDVNHQETFFYSRPLS